MKRRSSLLRLGSLLLFGFATAWGVAPSTAQAEPTHQPSATKAATPSIPRTPIGVSNLVVRLDGHADIGLAGHDYRIHIIEHLRARGFVAVGAESLVFDKDESRRARFRVGGIVRQVDCLHKYPQLACGLSVEWQLFDVGRDQVVYQVLSRAVVRDLVENDNERSALRLILATLDRFLQRPRFLGTIAQVDVGEGPSEQSFETASFQACPLANKRMPEAAEQVLDATVVVRTDLGFGSGVFISDDGLVLTSAHVVDTPSIKLRLRDGSEVPAAIVRLNRKTDVGLLRPLAPIGSHRCLAANSKAVPTMGAELYVAGAPASLDLAFSLTRGIVSGVREFDGMRLLQTDAPMSPGNSGGPVVGVDGSLVGIVRAKIVGHTVEGVGFAVPVDTALAALGLVQGTTTAASLRTNTAPPPAATESVKVVVDPPDPIESLDPEGDRQQQLAAEALQAQRVERERHVQRYRDTPTTLKVVAWSAVPLSILGTAFIWSSVAQDNAQNTYQEFHNLAVLNTAGWLMMGMAAGGVGAYFFLRPDLPAAAPATARSKIYLGPGSMVWQGTF